MQSLRMLAYMNRDEFKRELEGLLRQIVREELERALPKKRPEKANGHASGMRKDAAEIIGFLNEKTGRNFDLNGANAEHIIARLKEGETIDDCRAVIAMRCRKWIGDPRMSEYLRPKTLFNRTNFATYKGELVVIE